MKTQSNPMSKSGIHNTTMCGLVGRGERLVMQYPIAQPQICNSATKYKLFFPPFLLLFYSFFFFCFFAKYYVFHFGFAAKHSKCICHSSCNWSWIWVAILSTGWVRFCLLGQRQRRGGGVAHCRVLSRKRGFLIATERGECVWVCLLASPMRI